MTAILERQWAVETAHRAIAFDDLVEDDLV